MVHKLAHQLLCVLGQLSSLHVIHGDLKPENVALIAPNKAHIKVPPRPPPPPHHPLMPQVLDFGSACYAWEAVTSVPLLGPPWLPPDSPPHPPSALPLHPVPVLPGP